MGDVPGFQRWLGESAPRGEVIEYDGDHFDFYRDMFEHVVADFADGTVHLAYRTRS